LQIAALEQAGCDAIYEEKVSGVAKDRPVRDQILAELQRGDTLVIWKLDRLGRSAVELLGIVGDLERRGIKFKVVTQNIDTGTAMGRMFLTLLAGFAEFERELMRERVIAGKQRQRDEGRPMGPVPFGWTDADTVNPDQAALLREAADRALDGEPLNRIVDDWNAQDLRPGKAQRWRVTHLRRLLLNERTAVIVGQQRHNDLARLFAVPDRQRQGRPAQHLLSGVLHCGRDGCGQSMYAATKIGKPGGPPQAVYRCKRQSGGRFAGCGLTQVSATRADRWAREAFIAAVCEEDFAAALNQRQAELLADDTSAADLEAWRAEITDLENVPARFAPPDKTQRLAQLRRLVRDATARLMAQPDLQALLDLPKSEAELRDRWAGWTTAQRRAWLKRVLHHVVVKPATSTGRGSDVDARMDPVWRI
jgi:DNA invertase Pin-like site-specific DNA recombinase